MHARHASLANPAVSAQGLNERSEGTKPVAMHTAGRQGCINNHQSHVPGTQHPALALHSGRKRGGIGGDARASERASGEAFTESLPSSRDSPRGAYTRVGFGNRVLGDFAREKLHAFVGTFRGSSVVFFRNFCGFPQISIHLCKTYVLIPVVGPDLRKSPQIVREKRGKKDSKNPRPKFPIRCLVQCAQRSSALQ